MKFSPVWILAICHNFTAIIGYNIDIDTVRVVSDPTNQNDSLFGWKMEYFNKDLYVSAPRAVNNGRKDGEVYKCPENRKCLIVSRDSARVGDESNIWFGGELVSESGSMYACAPRTNQPRTLTLMTFIGSCYKYNTGTNRFDLFETFHDPSKYKLEA
ncbi:integrin alpha-8 [Eurytemora carolleeae]|uniref:integrin alpha-8 n=1 Tax=Eurytemora carolleeae TaxID=1294199 RepID=UPI000C76382B|nr:integrin alpha-8 [Eurytemora carolleeae]|eukprot:XP_023347303.1 integrin alpha-8-like [Eurytemora affinis]